MRNVRVYEEAWPLHTPFVIARGSRSEAKVVVVELEEDGVKGVGECTPYPRYGESIASVMAQVMAIGEQLEAGLTREQLQRLLPAGAARNAIDCALWDLQARREGKTLAQLLGVALPNRVITAQTVVIGTPDQMGGQRRGAVAGRGPAVEGEARRSTDQRAANRYPPGGAGGYADC
ncbi:L-Ala-D/L-Glu epimerase [Klebsiella pneumoniae]|uniref:L-Ala-D/L-Glu epimerase n=1 Tax=Klebsiella pneumoniae TaxID=573 RepID=A0A2X3F2B4_KLEPN|nr:L-Ala-D/L-Glu epimerase [Klebsiella pneumoniae]